MQLRLIILISTALLISCAKNEKGYRLTGLEGMDPATQDLVKNATHALNDQLGQELIQSDTEDGYPISVQLVEHIDGNNVLGSALIQEDECQISIRKDLALKEELLTSVLWHEIGHCLGLEHTGEAQDLMYYQSMPLDFYEDEDIEIFANRLLGSVDIH